MKKLSLFLAVVLVFGCKSAPTAPPFQSWGSDNENHSMLDITLKQPLVMVFVEDGEAGFADLKLAKEFQTELGEKAKVLGIIHDNVLSMPDLGKAHPEFVATIADPDLKIRQAYHVERAPAVVIVNKGGFVGDTWEEGLSAVKEKVANSLVKIGK